MTVGEEWGWGAAKDEARKVYETYREAGGPSEGKEPFMSAIDLAEARSRRVNNSNQEISS